MRGHSSHSFKGERSALSAIVVGIPIFGYSSFSTSIDRFCLRQIQKINNVSRALLFYSMWLILAFLSRVVIYSILALGLGVSSNPECPESPTEECDSTQHLLYVLAVSVDRVPSISVLFLHKKLAFRLTRVVADTTLFSSSASPCRKSPRCILWVRTCLLSPP